MIELNFPFRRLPRSPRTLIAIGLIFLSFFAALAIAGEAGTTTQVWAANKELTPGHLITSSDLTALKVLLPDNANHYFLQSQKLVGFTVSRTISAQELIARSALSRQSNHSSLRSLPVKVARGDMPIDLAVGEKVDLYAIPTSNNPQPFDPLLAANRVAVELIDQKSKDLGGEIGIVISVAGSEVLPIINEIENSRVLVVRHAF